MVLDVHIIFNESTDREDWLSRCVESLTHPDVNVLVHRFSENGCVRPRRSAILESHDSDNWVTFADPDDHVFTDQFAQYVGFLKTTGYDVVWPKEVMFKDSQFGSPVTRPHHLVCLRGDHVQPYPETQRYFAAHINQGVLFNKVVYCWMWHGNNTAGNKR